MEKIASVNNSKFSFLHMIAKTVHITQEQADFIDQKCINLSKFVRILLEQGIQNDVKTTSK